MPSLKSHLVALVLRHTRKRAFSSPEELNRWISAARKTENHRPPAQMFSALSVTTTEVCGFPVYEIAPKNPTRIRILYLHGGAYVFEITRYHWSLIAEMAARLNACITVPIYPIAPGYSFHDMFGMVERVYRQMLETADAHDIIFMGDSAGGNMAVVLTMMAARDGIPTPGRHVLISPGLDMSLENPDIYEVEKVDPWLGIPGGLEAIRHYSAGLDRRDWRISPIFGDLSVLPSTLILTGTRDLLYPDTVNFANKARAAGVDVELVVERGMFHVWPLIDMPEARSARNKIVRFLRDGSSVDEPPRRWPRFARVSNAVQ